MVGVLVLMGTLVLATAVGLVLKARQGRIRASSASGLPADIRALVAPTGVTLVQLSTTFCAPCRHTKALLSHLAARTVGLHHTELDVTNRPELARELSVLRTPTTLAIDGSGTEVLRVGGVPRQDDLLAALEPYLMPSSH